MTSKVPFALTTVLIKISAGIDRWTDGQTDRQISLSRNTTAILNEQIYFYFYYSPVN